MTYLLLVSRMSKRNPQVNALITYGKYVQSGTHMVFEFLRNMLVENDLGFREIYSLTQGKTKIIEDMIKLIKASISTIAKQNNIINKSQVDNIYPLIFKRERSQ